LVSQTAHAIVNPASGHGRSAKTWPPLKRQLEGLGLRIEEHRTRGPGDATVIARQLLQRGARELIVVGGDGTLNEAVNGYLDQDGHPLIRDAVLTIVPCGTGRDFPRLFGLHRPAQVTSVLRDGEICRVDVGVMEYREPSGRPARRFFVNMADAGLGAETAAWVSGSHKLLGGFLTYFLGATRTILSYRGRPLDLWVDGKLVHHGPALMVALANGRFHAGGMRIAPMASVTDGLLEVFVLQDVSRWQVLTSLLPAVYRGAHLGHPAVEHWTAQRVEIRSPEPIRIEMDGEQPGTTDVLASVVRQALSLRVPRGACPTAARG
jgi:YegS/Rv2252/BmrU family lipid kinase